MTRFLVECTIRCLSRAVRRLEVMIGSSILDVVSLELAMICRCHEPLSLLVSESQFQSGVHISGFFEVHEAVNVGIQSRDETMNQIVVGLEVSRATT
jgi:hypothetical protein